MAELTFRDIRASDYDDILALASIWSVVRQLDGWTWPVDPDLVRQRCVPYAKPNGFAVAICLNDRLVGTIGIIDADIGYAIHPDHQGQGLGTKAVRYAIDRHIRENPQSRRITAETWYDNPASHALLLKFGFEHWNTQYVYARARGTPTLSRTYRLRLSAYSQAIPSPSRSKP